MQMIERFDFSYITSNTSITVAEFSNEKGEKGLDVR